MQLEKVTSRSSEAALAGWISSNDVTLFTTMLVMVIADISACQAEPRDAKETVQITAEKASLTERLEATASERDAYDKLLDQTRGSLNLTQDAAESAPAAIR